MFASLTDVWFFENKMNALLSGAARSSSFPFVGARSLSPFVKNLEIQRKRFDGRFLLYFGMQFDYKPRPSLFSLFLYYSHHRVLCPVNQRGYISAIPSVRISNLYKVRIFTQA